MLRTPPPQTFPSETLSLDELFLKGKAGSITLDAQGIRLNGNIFLKGPVVVQGGSAGTGPTLTGAANEGQPIAQDCRGKADAQKETSE